MLNPWRGGGPPRGLEGQIRKDDHPGGFRDGEAASGPPASRTRRGGQADVAAWWRERSACGPRSCARSTGCNGQLARVGVPAAPFAVSHFASSRLRVRPAFASGLPQSRRGRRVPRRGRQGYGVAVRARKLFAGFRRQTQIAAEARRARSRRGAEEDMRLRDRTLDGPGSDSVCGPVSNSVCEASSSSSPR